MSYLDEIPERAPWTLVGCARSRSIHDWFYGGDVPMVDMCPRKLAESDAPPTAMPVITKCCLLEDRVSSEAGLVVVPWGASMAQIREGLRLALSAPGTAAAPGSAVAAPGSAVAAPGSAVAAPGSAVAAADPVPR